MFFYDYFLTCSTWLFCVSLGVINLMVPMVGLEEQKRLFHDFVLSLENKLDKNHEWRLFVYLMFHTTVYIRVSQCLRLYLVVCDAYIAITT